MIFIITGTLVSLNHIEIVSILYKLQAESFFFIITYLLSRMNKSKVLLVEDTRTYAEVVRRFLERENFEVIYAPNGSVALEMVMENMPDVVLCDVQMPLCDGFEFCKSFRQIPKASGVPFIFLTNQTESVDMRKGMGLGADDYIKKSATKNEIIEAIKIRLQKRKAIEEEVNLIISNFSGQLEKRDTTLGVIAQNQAHVIREPLAILLQIIGMIDMDDMGEENKRLVAMLAPVAAQMDKIIRENVYSINHIKE